jgi:hypothetical protein
MIFLEIIAAVVVFQLAIGFVIGSLRLLGQFLNWMAS